MWRKEASTFGVLDVLLIYDSWKPMWARFPIEVLAREGEDFGQRVERAVLNGAYFYEFDRVDNSRI